VICLVLCSKVHIGIDEKDHNYKVFENTNSWANLINKNPEAGLKAWAFFYNEPELVVEIDPGMALTPLPSSIGSGLNPRPSDREPSALPLDLSFR